MKKLISLGLAGIMTLSCGLSALAVEPNSDKTANVGAATSGNSETAFWLKVAEDESTETPTVDVTEIQVGTNGKYYKVDYKDQSKSNFSVTVPLYVAMYAYGQTGNVTAPSADAYKITNESQRVDKKWITKVTQYEKLSESAIALLGTIYNEDGKAITTDEELMSTGVTFNNAAGGQNKDAIKAIVAANDYFYIDNSSKLCGFAADNEAVLTLDGQDGHFRFIQDTTDVGAGWDGYAVEDPEAVDDQEVNIDVKVTEMKAKANGWNLVSSVPSRAKELYMTVNGVDLAKAVDQPYETNGSNWIIANGSENGLALPITAAIAANMNEYTTTQVVSVSYTVDVI